MLLIFSKDRKIPSFEKIKRKITRKKGEKPVKKQQRKNKKLHNHRLWLGVGMLAVMVVITMTLVGTYLFGLSAQNVSAISLYKGLLNDKTTSKTSQTKAESKVTILKGKKAKQEGFKVSDKENLWKTNTKIELFKLSYKNKEGKITVKSADQDKVVAPGTEGNYKFSIKNTGSKTARYKVWSEAEMSSNVSKLPIKLNINGKEKLSEQKSMEPGESIEYTIHWEWPFEQGNDEYDTSLGNLGLGNQNQEVEYSLTIHTIATDPGTQSTDDNNKRILFAHSGRTGDKASILLWSSIAAMSVIAIGVIILLWKRKEENE